MCDILTAVYMRCDRLPDILVAILNMEIYRCDNIPGQFYSSVYKIKVTLDNV